MSLPLDTACGRNMMIVVIAATNLSPENQYHERTITYDKRNGIR